MKLSDLCNILVILSLAAATGSAQMGYSMQNAFGLTPDINNVSPGGDNWGFSFPWYSSDISFSSSGFNISSGVSGSHDLSSAFSFFRGFYESSGMPEVSGIISTPIKFDITHREPARVYFGSGKELQYSKYVSTMASMNNELWIQGSSAGGIDWSQYVVCASGAWLQLVAYTPSGGPAGFYEIVQNDAKTLTYKTYQFYPGYNSMSFPADQVGRHVLLFIVDNQPSNVVIVDVFAQAPPAQQPMPPAIQAPPQGSYGQSPSGSGQYSYPQVSGPVVVQSMGDTPVTIQSSMKGYDVYLDGAIIGKEGTGGDPLDGVFRFNVVGGQTHTIGVFDGANRYEKPMFFDRGVPKIINVPPATTISY